MRTAVTGTAIPLARGGAGPKAAIPSAAGDTAVPYERRRPEATSLYTVVQDHVDTFFAQVEQETGTGLPPFVKDEFETFLECGILAHGFLPLRWNVCHVGGLLQNDELPRVDQGVGRRAVCQGRSLDELGSTAALVGHGVEGYRAAAPQGQGLSALATFA